VGDQALLIPPRLILITDRARLPGERFFEVIDAVLGAGVDAVLLREPQLDSARLLALASRLRLLTRRHNAHLLVHTQADVARAVQADGMHVSAENMGEIPAMRTWLNDPRMSFSASCHGLDELRQAHEQQADFAMLSPVFPTRSHPGAPHLGVVRFKEIADQSPVPVVALGGITPTNRTELGDYPVAVIGAILDADDAQEAARKLA
jgi:thiamine-phosphate pyrophosphorylase